MTEFRAKPKEHMFCSHQSETRTPKVSAAWQRNTVATFALGTMNWFSAMILCPKAEVTSCERCYMMLLGIVVSPDYI